MRLSASVGCHLRSLVSVPLPGFSGLRPLEKNLSVDQKKICFSPVAGIQWVETIAFVIGSRLVKRSQVSVPLPGFSGLRLGTITKEYPKEDRCFSPVAGIQWVETWIDNAGWCKVLIVSVPLPGFSGLRHR